MYQDDEVIAAVRELGSGAELKIDLSTITEARRERKRTRITLAVVASSLALVAVSLTVWQFGNDHHSSPRAVGQPDQQKQDHIGAITPGCGPPITASVVGSKALPGTLPSIAASAGNVAANVALSASRPSVTVTGFELILAEPETQAAAGPSSGVAGSALDPANQIATTSAPAANLSARSQLELDASGLAPGSYPLFAVLHFTDLTPCNGVTFPAGASMRQVASILVSG